MLTPSSIPGYDRPSAAGYDDRSAYDKGNRDLHRIVLGDILRQPGARPFSDFLELGCGTGFFSASFFEANPQAQGTLVDGSAFMLDKARAALRARLGRLELMHARFEQLPWLAWTERFDVAFSALALHHVAGVEKAQVFEGLHRALRPGGRFILFDLIRCRQGPENDLLEYLACRDIQRRLMRALEVDEEFGDLRIDRIIARDREVRAAERDQEAPLDADVAMLRSAGFTAVACVFQDFRIAGLVAVKPL